MSERERSESWSRARRRRRLLPALLLVPDAASRTQSARAGSRTLSPAQASRARVTSRIRAGQAAWRPRQGRSAVSHFALHARTSGGEEGRGYTECPACISAERRMERRKGKGGEQGRLHRAGHVGGEELDRLQGGLGNELALWTV
jgi:hypothetical protein